MVLEVLNNFTGDSKIELDTSTPEGRAKVKEEFQKLLRAGTAIFLERADKTYRITGYDPETDSLKVDLPAEPVHAPEAAETAASRLERFPCKCPKCEDCPNTYAKSKYGICSPCQQGKHGGRKIETTAKPRAERGDRVTAVAPRAGG